ncbi:hypothetical protein [Sphingomonas astaxanthinifaciens]|uniref:Uncharacterized protein n=1 Tax=Sphingomonas astaxanthinifaciens DSM 22298 TaxID=1123267 RepID=A0ABQ5Z837_9SPHN|nr:hypothetical protein [Sphingomonas astaxanthinifaciens]GLR47626.1 hypothetical protein GCM10007925_13390 [Sphingomonas astaxanthinifaciens DSM 22298]
MSRNDIFKAVESGDAHIVAAVVDPVFKQAAREASRRAHGSGLTVYDGRASDIRDVFGMLERDGQQPLSIEEINDAIEGGWAGKTSDKPPGSDA